MGSSYFAWASLFVLGFISFLLFPLPSLLGVLPKLGCGVLCVYNFYCGVLPFGQAVFPPLVVLKSRFFVLGWDRGFLVLLRSNASWVSDGWRLALCWPGFLYLHGILCLDSLVEWFFLIFNVWLRAWMFDFFVGSWFCSLFWLFNFFACSSGWCL